MNSHPEEDLQRRLEKLEAEVNAPDVLIRSPETMKPSFGSFSGFQARLTQLIAWFKSLPVGRKLIVLSVAFLLGFSILQAILKLVAAVISLALLSILVYLGYKFFVSDSQIK